MLDEYHFEFLGRKQTIRQAAQRLLDIGLAYNTSAAQDAEEGCLLFDQLASLIPVRPCLEEAAPLPLAPPAPSP